MIKLKIKDIEAKLGKTIRQNCISVGFDVAEHFTGVCVLKADKEFITIDDTQVIETSANEDHFNRADHYIATLGKFKQKLEEYKNYKILVIEACHFGKNPQTLIHLAHFGILTYRELKKSFDTWHYFGASTARSMVGFNQKNQQKNGTFKAELYKRDTKDKAGKLKHKKGEKKKVDCKSLVHNYLETEFGLKFDSKDEADAFVLALAGLLA